METFVCYSIDWCSTTCILTVNVCPVIKQQTNHLRITIYRYIIEGSLTPVGWDFKISVFFNKQFHHFIEIFVCCSINWCLITYILTVNICSVIKQQTNYLWVTIYRYIIEGSLTPVGWDFKISIFLNN